jgi:hypothetical protein
VTINTLTASMKENFDCGTEVKKCNPVPHLRLISHFSKDFFTSGVPLKPPGTSGNAEILGKSPEINMTRRRDSQPVHL